MKVSTQLLVGLTKLWWAGWEQQHASLQMVFPQSACTEAWAKLAPGLGRLVPTTLVPGAGLLPPKIGADNSHNLQPCDHMSATRHRTHRTQEGCFLLSFLFLLRILLKWNTPTCVPLSSQPKKAPWNFQDYKQSKSALPFSQSKFQDQELRPVFPLLDKLHVVLALLWLFFFSFIFSPNCLSIDFHLFYTILNCHH